MVHSVMPQKCVVLHIGGGKTGSSFLQYCFAHLEAQFRGFGVLYPESRDGEHDRARSGRVTSGNGLEIAKYLNGKQELESIVADLGTAISMEGISTVLYSSEAMQSFQEERLGALDEWVAWQGCELRVVYYVRSVAGRAYSAYVQRVKKHGESRRFEQWIRGFRYPGGTVARNLESVLGRGRFFIRNYDHVSGDLFGDFAAAALPEGCKDLNVEQAVVNRSLSPVEVEMMLELNRMLGGSQASRLGQSLMSSANQGSGAVVSEAERYLLEKKTRDDLLFVNRYLSAGHHVSILGPNDRCGDRNAAMGERDYAFIALIAELARGLPNRGG